MIRLKVINNHYDHSDGSMETDCKDAGKDHMENGRIMHSTGGQRKNKDILNQAVTARNG